VDLVEFFSGLDFFSALPDSAEELPKQEPTAVALFIERVLGGGSDA